MNQDLDAVDRKLLNILQTNARVTHKQLADQLNLSTTPVYERIKKLERRGVIKGYVALLDKQQINKNMVVFVSISSKEHYKSKVDEIFGYIQHLPEVMECYHISGTYDFLLKVVVPGMEEYEKFLMHKLATLDNIASVQSNFALSTVKYKTDFAL